MLPEQPKKTDKPDDSATAADNSASGAAPAKPIISHYLKEDKDIKETQAYKWLLVATNVTAILKEYGIDNPDVIQQYTDMFTGITDDPEEIASLLRDRFEPKLECPDKPKLCAFLDVKNLPEANKLFISIGPGKILDQVLTRPYMEEQKAAPVLGVVIDINCEICKGERGYNPGSKLPMMKPRELYQLLGKIQHYEVEMPDVPINDEVVTQWKTISADQRHRIDWDTEAEAQTFRQQWKDFITACVEQGKEIILGYYCGYHPTGFILDTYNELKAKYPDKIFMIMQKETSDVVIPLYKATEQDLAKVDRSVEAARVDPTFQRDFKFISLAEGGLMHPDLTLDNLKKWAVEARDVTARASAAGSAAAVGSAAAAGSAAAPASDADQSVKGLSSTTMKM